MTENSIVEFEVRHRIRTTESRYLGFIAGLREIAIESINTEVITPEGEQLVFEVPNVPDNPAVVSFDYIHSFYKHQFVDEATSPLPGNLINKLANIVGVNGLKTNNSGKFIGFDRKTLLELTSKLKTGESTVLSGKKTLRLLYGVLDSLPDEAEPDIL